LLISLELFVMLVLANGAPVVAAGLLKGRWSQPVDGGRLWPDGRPVLGKSKTWRGLIAGCLTCGAFAFLVDLGAFFGLVFGFLSLFGDMISSFIKRRMGLASSARALWLDQIPEAALPLGFAVIWLPMDLWLAVLLAVLFALANILLSPLLYRLGIRRQPH